MTDRTYDDLEEALGREIELKERIRELETELSHRNVAEEIGEVIEFWAARAEKAEKALADMDKPWSANYWYVAWKESQARVAELLKQHCGHCGKPWVVRVGEIVAREAREREEG